MIIKEVSSPHLQIFISPARAFIGLEREGFLSRPVAETSPLRRTFTENGGEVALVWDSRVIENDLEKVVSQPRFIFFARAGLRFDSHSLVETVLSSGNIFIGEETAIEKFLKTERRPAQWIKEILTHPFLIRVHSTEVAMKRILELACPFTHNDFTSVTVTGTNGKTSVTEICSQLLGEATKEPVMRMGTLGIKIGEKDFENNYPTMPDFAGFLLYCSEAKKKSVSHIVFESTSQGLVENRLGNWLTDVAIYTNLTQDHLDYHKNMDAYKKAKGLLFVKHLKHNAAVVVNTDDAQWEYFALKGAGPHRNCIGVGSEKNKKKFFATLSGKYVSLKFLVVSQKVSRKTGIQGIWSLETERSKISETPYSCPLIGNFQQENLSVSVAALLSLGYPLSQVTKTVTTLKPVPGRLQVVTADDERKRNLLPTVIVDYAHSPDALEKAIVSCKETITGDGKLIAVFGCGGDRDVKKRPLMGRVCSDNADLCIVTSDNPRTESPETIIDDIMAGAPDCGKMTRLADRRKAIEESIKGACNKDIVLIAGKGHEDYQIIADTKLPFSDVDIAKEILNQLTSSMK